MSHTSEEILIQRIDSIATKNRHVLDYALDEATEEPRIVYFDNNDILWVGSAGTYVDFIEMSKNYEAYRAKMFGLNINVGELYVHYRDPSKTYKVRYIALDEKTQEVVVVYTAMYGLQLTWARFITKWFELVNHNGKKVSRFSLATC